MFLISYLRIFTPQVRDASLIALTIAELIVVRSSNVLSRSIFPISLRIVVCESCTNRKCVIANTV